MRAWLLRVAQLVPFLGGIPLLRGLGLAPGEGMAMPLFLLSVGGFVFFLVISLATRRLPRVRHRSLWISTSLALVATSTVATIWFSVQFGRLTFFYEPEGMRFVRGAELTEAGTREHERAPNEDTSTLVANFGGVSNRELIWTSRSLDCASLWLGLGTALVVFSLGGAIFGGLELSGVDEPRAVTFPKGAAKPLQEQRAARRFDVFLSHNSQDKPAVKEVALRLLDRNILPWLDEWELRPGTPWVPALEAELRSARSAAVFIGPNGSGGWQAMETNALLDQFVKRGAPVIPVLLPGVEGTPDLPAFLGAMTWVDMRKTDPDPIEQLIFGINGRDVPGAHPTRR